MTRTAFSVVNQRVVVIGAGRSGRAAAELCAARGARVTLADSSVTRPDDASRLEGIGIAVECGPHREGLLTTADLVVLSPGVPFDQPVLAEARRRGVPVIGEVELASRWIDGRIVAITGTKGKSTTTTLTARILQQGGVPAIAGGNLGVALSSQVSGARPDTIHVVEVSSFQLESIDSFHPWIAVLVNLSPDHLDRHATFEAYAAAKARVFANQTDADWAVVNADDPAALELARTGRARRFDFGFDSMMADGVTVNDTHIVLRRAGVTQPLVPLSAVRVPGRHLLADVMAAVAVSVLVDVSSAAMTQAVEGFEGLEHALERVAAVSGVRFINDSKATNVISAKRAIESFERGVVPILGGRYKGGAFEDLREALQARADGVVVLGESADAIEKALNKVVPVVRARSMEEAVAQAFGMASSGGVVLLAPACSSFDMFANYAERGLAFKRAARALVAEVEAAQRA
jgi:UDP-N-acetylmuramoylalanine--D-glutamate ligase